jgi:LacI family purine nucleotide synthesis repressor
MEKLERFNYYSLTIYNVLNLDKICFIFYDKCTNNKDGYEMPTIKDVAKLAGVSISTVSIVLNDKAEERKVAKETAEKVLEAIKTLEYKPSMAARRLRSSDDNKPVIALYWPLDYRTAFLARVLMGLQGEIKRRNFDCEVIVCTYENDNLYKENGLTNKNKFNAAIIGATSEKDMEYLEGLESSIPIVLYNRYIDRYNCVCNNDEESGFKAASIFAKNGHKKVALICEDGSPIAARFRISGFYKACKTLGIEIEEEYIIKTENTYKGGVLAAEKILKLSDMPRAVICDSEMLAIGASYVFNKNNVKIPEDMEIISYGLMSTDSTEYTTPPLTIVSIPTEEMSAYCIQIIIDILNLNKKETVHKIVSPNLLVRDSVRQ